MKLFFTLPAVLFTVGVGTALAQQTPPPGTPQVPPSSPNAPGSNKTPTPNPAVPGAPGTPGSSRTPGATPTSPATPGAVPAVPAPVLPGGAAPPTAVVTPPPAGPAARLSADQKFILEASSGGQFELASSRLALQKSNSAAVKKFAQQMIDDHTRVNQELDGLLRQRGVVPTTDLSLHHEAMIDKLQLLSGTEFDRTYWKQQLLAHEEALAVFEGEARHGQDPNLRTFAGRTVGALTNHRDMLRDAMRTTGVTLEHR
jgi:putative membrane protein